MKNENLELDFALDFYDIREDEDCFCNLEEPGYCKLCSDEILEINETLLLA